MKVIIVINTLGSGGAERSMLEYARFLYNQQDIDVKFICLEHKNIGVEKEVEASGIPVMYYEGQGGYYTKAKFLINILKKENPEIIHSLLTESNIITRLSRIFYRKGQLVQSLVNTPYSEERKKDSKLPWQKFQLAKQLDIWTARLTPNIFYHSITQEVLKHYQPLFKIKDNFRVIHRGRYKNKFLGEKKALDTGITLINSGRQEFAKGQIDILKALVILRDKHHIEDIRLEILGRPGTYSSLLQDYIAKHGLEKKVSIHGFVEDVQRRLVQADVFVFPSYYEGLGGALLEAFAAKLPCLCTNIPVLKEVVGSEKGALFSKPGDPEGLAENIKKVHHDQELRRRLSDYVYNRFLQSFRMEKINKEMLQMYNDIL